MTNLSVPNAFTSGTPIVASEVNANFDAVKTFVNVTGVPVVQDGVVATAKLADGAVSNAKLASEAVDTAQLKASAVTSAKVSDSAVTAAKIADGAVETAKLADDAVSRAKITPVERVPTGAIFDFAGTTAPTGWLLCDGAAVSRTTYADLFALVGTAFGAGDGSTTFNLPDLRGRVGVGLDDLGGTDANRLSVANTLGGSGGTQTHTLTVGEIPSHTHEPSGSTNFVTRSAGGGSGFASGSNVISTGSTATAATGGGGAHNNMQPYLLLGKIIKF